MTALHLIILLVTLQRLGEMALATYNTRRLKAAGATEIGAGHYPLFILLHASWLLAVLLAAPPDQPPNLFLLSVFILLQLGRIWVIASLGRFWTTRIITLPHAALIKKGPYRFLNHPNYLIVIAEIAVLPLMFDEFGVCVIWSVANALLLGWRIKLENAALASRRA